MTYEEALYQITNYGLDDEMSPKELREAAEVFREAVEKRIPKKPKITLSGTTGWNTVCHCPSCCGFLVGTDKFCHKCGQALYWSNNDG